MLRKSIPGDVLTRTKKKVQTCQQTEKKMLTPTDCIDHNPFDSEINHITGKS